MNQTTPSTVRRALAVAFLAIGLLAVPGVTGPAAAATSAEARVTARSMNHNQVVVVDQINRARRARARSSLSTNGLMNKRAMNWAAHLAACQCLEHRGGAFGAPRGWCAAAENVGRSGNGGTLGSVHDAFMRSSGHKANILNRRWTALGVGVARDRQGEYFVVHAFADLAC